MDEIPKKLPELGVTGVVSVNEEFERVVTLSSDEWNRIGVELLKVNCGDFNFAPKPEDLKAAADFIQNKVEGTTHNFKIYDSEIFITFRWRRCICSL